MKIIRLVGGSSWVSTVEYYRFINEEVNRRLVNKNETTSLNPFMWNGKDNAGRMVSGGLYF